MIENPWLVVDIETIPDVALLRKLYQLPDTISTEAVVAEVENRRTQQGLSLFLPPHLHQIVAIGVLWRHQQDIVVRCLGAPEDNEEALLRLFFGIIERHQPLLISWNGGSFDLPVMQMRALNYPIIAGHYWDQGRQTSQTKFNNYRNRYHERHLDVMDLLANYHARNFVPLDQICTMLGLPGKMGECGSDVRQKIWQGEVQSVRDYCCLDVANTYLVWLYWARQAGWISPERFMLEQQMLLTYLSPQSQWQKFIQAWSSAAQIVVT